MFLAILPVALLLRAAAPAPPLQLAEGSTAVLMSYPFVFRPG